MTGNDDNNIDVMKEFKNIIYAINKFSESTVNNFSIMNNNFKIIDSRLIDIEKRLCKLDNIERDTKLIPDILTMLGDDGRDIAKLYTKFKNLKN